MTITATDIKRNGVLMFDALLGKVEKLTINDHTTKVVHPSENLQLRNALYAIDDYQSMLNPWLADKRWIGGSRVNNIGYSGREVA